MSNITSIIDALRGLFQRTDVLAPVDFGGNAPMTNATIVTHHKDVVVTDLTSSVRDAITSRIPERRHGFAKINEPDSMAIFINRFRDDDSLLFASLGDRHRGGSQNPSLRVVFDHDRAGPESFDAELGLSVQARPGRHGAIYDFPLTDAFVAWLNIGKSGVDQTALHNFLQDRVDDFMDPTPALIQKDPDMADAEWEERLARLAQRLNSRFGDYRTLLAASLTFEVEENQNLRVSRNPDTGETRFEFQNEHRTATGARIELPNLFLLGIQVFVGGPIYRLPVRMRYAKDGPKVKFFLTIPQLAEVMERATRQLVEEVLSGVDDEIPLIWGTPGH